MSGCLALDEALPALTSRLLLLLEDEEDLLVLKPQTLPTPGNTTASRLEESKEPEEASPMLVAPYNNNGGFRNSSCPLWSSARFDTIPERGLSSIPSFPLPSSPSTPLSKQKGLFAPFPSSPMPQDLWQYGEAREQHPSFLSPRTTDAVFEETKKAAVEAVWCKNSNENAAAAAVTTKTTIPLMAPSLLPVCDEIPGSRSPPSIIRYRTRSGSSSSSISGFDDDEVSLLADDPDEDDAGVLPPATYTVVVNILDEIDRDDEDEK